MAPSRTSTVKNKYRAKITTTSSKGVGSSKNKAEISKSQKSTNTKIYGKQQKNGSGKVNFKRKRKVYTEKELNVPVLNMITPIGVQKPKGQKKGKVFVDDRESMLTILSIVDAEKSNLIESKMMKARQLEEIREARRVENEKKKELKKESLTELKESMRKKRKRLFRVKEAVENNESPGGPNIKQKKNVSFA